MSDGTILREGDGISDIIGEIQNAHIQETDDFPGDYDHIETSEEFPELKDASGNVFNPNYHDLDENGQPKLTKNGNFRKKRGGAGNSGPRLNIPGHGAVDLSDTSAVAETAATLYIQTGVIFFGPEWLPDPAKMEKEFLVKHFHDYFEEKGITDFPPGVALAIACFAYAGARMHKPNTSQKIMAAIDWCKLRIGGLIWRVKYGARNDTRPNGVRKNDAGQAYGKAGARRWFGRSRS